MRCRSKLFRVANPFDIAGTDALFVNAMRENCRFHYEHCREYRTILEHFHFHPDSLNTSDDLARLPFIPTLLFKKHSLFSMPERSMLIKATSSGTKGVVSRIGFEASGLLNGLRMVLKVGKYRGLFSMRPAHYIILGYKPHRGNKTAVTKTAFGATLFAPALSRTYALQYRDNAYVPDLDAVIDSIQRHGRSGFPIRFMGFPAYTYFVLKLMEERGISVPLKKGSKIMMGGGWKQFYAEQVDKRVLYALAEKVLGIGESDIIEFFGAVEHPVLYCDCVHHHFHIPAYSRVIIRDVHTLEPLENGQVGLVNLLTPMVKATPIASVMTDDLGILHDGGSCGCGLTSPYLEIIGRVGLKDIKTCAAGAAALLAGNNTVEGITA